MISPSRVSLEKTEYETLAAAAKKYYAQEKQEGKLKKLLNDAKKNHCQSKSKNRIAGNGTIDGKGKNGTILVRLWKSPHSGFRAGK